MVALLTDSFGLKSSKLAQLDSTKFDEEPFCAQEGKSGKGRKKKDDRVGHPFRLIV